jgi:hypothetical protein
MDNLEEWRRYWSNRYGRELSDFEAKEIRDNLAGFYKLLIKIEERTAEQGDRCPPTTGDH